MTVTARFIVTVNADWTVSVTGPAGPILPAPDPLWSATGPAAPPADCEPAKRFLYQLWQQGATPALPELYDRIFVFEQYTRQDVEDLGRYLFDRLLGAPAWNTIFAAATAAGGEVFELALRFDGERYELHRFPWELMHGPADFLAQGAPSASVTRLVARAGSAGPLSPAAFSSPPRLLFAVGASLTDRRIRPGAEIFGMLRQLHSRGLTVYTRTRLPGSTTSLNETIAAFKPDLVHFTCHGDIEQDGETARGFLEFQQEDKQAVVHRGAAELLGNLRFNGRTPTVVVLSACYSGVMPPAPSTPQPAPVPIEGPPRTAGADRIGSLAAELVAGGVPVVVGMGGRVADSACRLFTRYFGEALVRGDPLVAAIARGRRAAFLDGAPDTADWSFPVLFLDADLDPGYAPAMPVAGAGDSARVLADRIQAYGTPRYPVFHGRHDFFERYERLFRPGASQTLPIFSRGDGLGRTRLLRELAAQALLDGHIPCLVTSDKHGWPDPPFGAAADLAVEILRAIDNARKWFGLPPPFDSSILAQLISARNRPDLAARLMSLKKRSAFLSIVNEASQSPGDSPPADVCQAALQEDFETLIQTARAAAPPLAGPQSRVLLLLDDVHKFGDAISPLLHTLIGKFGLGILGEPVPVILCYARGTAADPLFDEASEIVGKLAMELKPFDTEVDEDLIALELALLFPDVDDTSKQDLTDFMRGTLNIAIEGPVATYAYNHRAPPAVRDFWVNVFRHLHEGIPGKINEPGIYREAMFAFRDQYLVIGDDEARLSKLCE